jgi:hypothetical protein
VILPALAAPFRSLPSGSPVPTPEPDLAFGPMIERIESFSDRPADASAAAAGYSRPRTGS